MVHNLGNFSSLLGNRGGVRPSSDYTIVPLVPLCYEAPGQRVSPLLTTARGPSELQVSLCSVCPAQRNRAKG